MSRNVLDKYGLSERSAAGQEARGDDANNTDGLACYGMCRGAHEKAVMLELIKRDGSIVAIGYAWIHKMEYDPAGRIVLHTDDQPITICGRNLNRELAQRPRLFSLLARQRVPWIREADRASLMQADDDRTVIESLEW